MQNTEQSDSDQFLVYNSIEELLEAAEEQALKAPKEYQESLRFYFIARYFVSVYESRFTAIPIQVWNEYRNATDHMFRQYTNASGSAHISKMQNHLLRAGLDTLKLFCHDTIDYLNKEMDKHKREVLALVDNGNYLSNFNNAFTDAQKVFEAAKTSDAALGADHKGDMEVLKTYLNAAFELDKILYDYRKKNNAIEQAYAAHKAISDRASNHSTWHHLGVHALFYTLMAIGSLVVGMLSFYVWEPFFEPYAEEIVSYIKSFFGSK